jgi:hypothetical protein
MDLESVREKYRFIDTQSQAELEFLYDKQFLKEGVLDVKSVEGLPSELAIQYATNVTKIGVSNEYMVHAREINVKMQDTLVMIKEWEAQGEDTTPLVALYNEFARLSAIALVEGVKGLPLSDRLVALNLSIFDNQKAVCLGELDYRSAGDGAGSVTPDLIYEVAVSGIPIPDLTSWEDILDLKADKAKQHRLQAFHIWVADICKTEQTKADIADRIEFLTREYSEALTAAKLKHYPGLLKCIVVGGAALVENIAKFKLKDAANIAFKLTEARANLLEEERKAPGRELSFLVEAARSVR